MYIKDGPGFGEGTFPFADFQVINTGDDLLDLAHYTRNEIVLESRSSYAVIGAFGSTEKKVVIHDLPISENK